MSDARIEVDTEGRLVVSGELNVDTVPGLWRRAGVLFVGGGEYKVELADVQRSDSAGVALLVEWMRLAQRQQASIAFVNMPEQMLAIARLSELDQVLPLAHD